MAPSSSCDTITKIALGLGLVGSDIVWSRWQAHYSIIWDQWLQGSDFSTISWNKIFARADTCPGWWKLELNEVRVVLIFINISELMFVICGCFPLNSCFAEKVSWVSRMKKKKKYQFTKSSRNGCNVLRAGGLRPQPRLGPGCPYIHATRRVAHEYESSQVHYQLLVSHLFPPCL